MKYTLVDQSRVHGFHRSIVAEARLFREQFVLGHPRERRVLLG